MPKKLLIVDDDAAIRRLIHVTLESEDYVIIEASDGDEALAMARAHRPDLILLDVMMPVRSGLDVCGLLKSSPDTAHGVIVMLTARGQEEDRRAALEAGADDYFTKPFSPIALLRKVDTVLAGSDAAVDEAPTKRGG